MIAAGAGLVLIISLFLEWYNVTGKGLAVSAGSQGLTGWESLSFIDRTQETLGRSDAGIAFLRRVFWRELDAIRAGRPTKTWRRLEQSSELPHQVAEPAGA